MKDFESAKEKFINDYLNTKFPGQLRELYNQGVPNVVAVLRAGLAAGAEWGNNYARPKKLKK